LEDGHEYDGSLVLLAEDNEINRLVAVRMLEKQGFRVDVAPNGRVALEMCRRRSYKLVFMDCQMPKLDGYETTVEIRRREGTGHHMPIIAMTANTLKGDRDKCLAAGMDDYIAKPIEPTALSDAIARSLDMHRGRARNRGQVSGEAGEVEPQRDGRTPLLDRSILDDVCEGDAQMHQDLIALFGDQSQAGMADMGRAIQIRDSEALQQLAHKLKGSSASVGAPRMAELCECLCQAGRTGLLSDATGLLEELDHASQLTRAAWDA
jgi:CheY-like chemotaxis protein